MEGDRLDVLQEFCLEEDEIFFFAIQKRYWDSTILYIYIYIYNNKEHIDTRAFD